MATTTTPTFGSSSALTTTNLQSLATDSNLLAGWSSAVQDNTSDEADDVILTGTIELGTSPTVNTQVQIRVWEILDDTPTYPDTITGSEATITLTSSNVQNAGAFKVLQIINVDATTNRVYPWTARLSSVFGGTPPKKWGMYIVHNTGVNLKSSGNVVTKTTVKYTSA